MINEKTKREIAIMEAFLEGRRIQVSIRGGQWLDTPIPAWDWGFCDYRIVDGASRKTSYACLECEAKTRDCIEVMRAHLQGKTIQKRKYEWIDLYLPKWDWGVNEYRIKPVEGGEQ